ncbi:MAG: hypothetical protein ACRCTD_14620 [Beijerinckiaceae bacterium]
MNTIEKPGLVPGFLFRTFFRYRAGTGAGMMRFTIAHETVFAVSLEFCSTFMGPCVLINTHDLTADALEALGVEND